MPKSYEIEKFYFCEGSEESVQRSYEIIQERAKDGGFFDKCGVNLPTEIIPTVVDDGDPLKWAEIFKTDELDMIVSNTTMHWVNDLEGTLRGFRESLIPDGVFLGSVIGGDSLQELRICLNLAESERDGGVSPTVSPLLSLTDMGNVFSRSGHFNLPTVDITHMQYEFTSTFQLFEFIQEIAEQNCLLSKRKKLPEATLIAAAALFETLFTKRAIGQRDEYTSSVLIDTFKDTYMHPEITKRERDSNIICSMDIVFLIGWK